MGWLAGRVQKIVVRLEEFIARFVALDKAPRLPASSGSEPDEEHLFDLWRLIDASFNEDEMRTLTFALGVDYDGLAGVGKSGKARELITFMRRSNRLGVLVEWCMQFRDSVNWSKFQG